MIQKTFCLRCHGFLQLRYSNPSQTKQCSSLSYGHSYCGQKLSLAHSCSKWGVRFISSESTHGVVLMKEQGEIKHEVEMSLRNLLWSVGSQNTMWIKLDDSQQGQTHKTASFLKESWHFFLQDGHLEAFKRHFTHSALFSFLNVWPPDFTTWCHLYVNVFKHKASSFLSVSLQMLWRESFPWRSWSNKA